ncbi:hypothetical protein ABEF95_003954 [Exophiala dermatitidis]
MGRHAHIARLALGRSPFEPPLQDDRGDFVLGPNVQLCAARNYVQYFDSRGHPQNFASEASRTRLIRAQNDALSTVGVVVRKAKRTRSSWQNMSDEQKHMLLISENIAGANLGIIVDVLQRLSTWWIVCFRRRLLIYKSYLGLSIPELILSEWRTSTTEEFFSAGLLSAAISKFSQSWRNSLINDRHVSNRSRSQSVSYSSGMVRFIRKHSLQLLWVATAEYPFYAFSVLQSLYLVPVNAAPPLLAFIPFTASSPIRLPDTLSDSPWPYWSLYLLHIASSPFVLCYIKDQIGRHVFKKVYQIVRHLLVKPDRPDRSSLPSARRKMSTVSERAIATVSSDRRHPPPSSKFPTLLDIFGTFVPVIFWVWEKAFQSQRTPLTVELSPDIEEELTHRIILHYRNLLRQDLAVDVELRRPPRMLRVLAIQSAFSDYNLDPDRAVDVLADELNFDIFSDVSTATPDPLDPTVIEDAAAAAHGQTILSNGVHTGSLEDSGATASQLQSAEGFQVPHAESSAEEDGTEGFAAEDRAGGPVQGEVQAELSLQPTAAPETLPGPESLEAGRNDLQGGSIPLPELSAPELLAAPASRAPSPAASPVPGISRAVSLSNAPPRPVRRPTDVDEDLRPTRDDSLYHEDPSRKTRRDDEPLYRVTLLSNHPAETFALFAASIMESAVLLPFEMLFLRSLAHNFLAHPWADTQISRTLPPRAEEWSLRSWLVGRGHSTTRGLRLFGSCGMVIGIQAFISLAIWNVGTHVTLRLGRQFGWGKI